MFPAIGKWLAFRRSTRYDDFTGGLKGGFKSLLFSIFRLILLVGISYVILAPVIGIVSSSFFSNSDAYNPMVFTIPIAPTLERYARAISRMDYFPTVLGTILYSLSLSAIQVLVCACVGYGFARFQFPLKKVLFACVVVMIVLPSHAIMLPLYIIFRNFDPLGLFSLLHLDTNLMGTPWPAFIMTILGCGLRSGLYIYIFTQFFRGLPREIEEAAFVDGAGTFYTFFRIMLANAAPAVVTVAVFSLVWQYNDTFFGNLFRIGSDILVSKKLSSLQVNIATVDKILDIAIQELYVNAGVVLVMLPVVILYLVLQKRFIEGIERSGIVG
jgi:multiple sugar transport system permease protein